MRARSDAQPARDGHRDYSFAMPTEQARPATIIDVARRAGVAISSASAALNGRPGVSETTRERIRSAAAELGYMPSLRGRSMVAKRTFSVGLVVQRDFDVIESDPFFGAFIGGIEETLSQRDYALSLQIAQDETAMIQRHLDLVNSQRVDGIFLNEIQVHDPRVDLLLERRIPSVGTNPDPDFPFPAVRQDATPGIRQLVTQLAQLGHQHIAHISGDPRFIHTHQRIRAWKDAMAQVGLPANMIITSDFTAHGGEAATTQVLDLTPRPTAIFCANDLTAIGLINGLQAAGLQLPNDMSIAGFDGIHIGSYIRPSLTTIQTSPRAIGREAARLLLEIIDGTTPPDVAIQPGALLNRASVTPRRTTITAT